MYLIMMYLEKYIDQENDDVLMQSHIIEMTELSKHDPEACIRYEISTVCNLY